jgi:hypothetical protein
MKIHTRSERRIQDIYVNRNIDFAIPNSGFDLIYDASDTEVIEIAGFDD